MKEEVKKTHRQWRQHHTAEGEEKDGYSRGEARFKASRLVEKTGLSFSAYLCNWCGLHHIGKTDMNTLKRIGE